MDIFNCATVTFKGGWTHDGDYASKGNKCSPNLVLLNEISSETQFSGSQLEDMKNLMEGSGCCVNKKHQPIVLDYVKCGVYLNSNDLPKFSRSMTMGQKKLHWEALQRRTFFHYCGNGQDSTGSFSLSADDVAQLMQFLQDHITKGSAIARHLDAIVENDIHEFTHVRRAGGNMGLGEPEADPECWRYDNPIYVV